MYGVDGGDTRASGPTCTRRAFQVRPHSIAASKQPLLAGVDLAHTLPNTSLRNRLLIKPLAGQQKGRKHKNVPLCIFFKLK